MTKKLKIGWTTNGELSYENLTMTGDTGWRIPIIEKLIERGHEVYWLGVKPHLATSDKILKGLKDCYYLKFRLNDYDDENQSASEYYTEVLSTYKGNIDFPELDILFYEPRDFCVSHAGWQWTLLDHYCQRPETVVTILDADAVFLSHQDVPFAKKGDLVNRLKYSLGDRVVLLHYLAFGVREEINKDLPYKNLERFLMTGMPRELRNDSRAINPDPKYLISYVGNDYDRRKMFEKFFSNEIKTKAKNPDGSKVIDKIDLGYTLHLFGKWSEEYLAETKFDQVKYYGIINQEKAFDVYYDTVATLNLSRSIYAKNGWMSLRMFDVLDMNNILLLSDDFWQASKLAGERFVVSDKSQLKSVLDILAKLTPQSRQQIVDQQKTNFYNAIGLPVTSTIYDIAYKQADLLEMCYDKYFGKLEKKPFDIGYDLTKKYNPRIATDEEAKAYADNFSKKKALTVKKKRERFDAELSVKLQGAV